MGKKRVAKTKMPRRGLLRRRPTYFNGLEEVPGLQQLRKTRVCRSHHAEGAKRFDKRQELLLLAVLVEDAESLVNAAAGAPQMPTLVFTDDVCHV